jgi:hypothetical protein
MPMAGRTFASFRSYFNGGPEFPVCELFGGLNFNGGTIWQDVWDRGYDWGPRSWVDVNGDRRVDVCRAVGDWPGIFLACAINHGTGWVHYGLNSPGGWDFGYGHLPRMFGDVGNDGYMDYCRFVGDSNYPTLSCAGVVDGGFTWGAFTGRIADLGYSWMPRAMADANGDGLADFCRFVGESGAPRLACAVAKSYYW